MTSNASLEYFSRYSGRGALDKNRIDGHIEKKFWSPDKDIGPPITHKHPRLKTTENHPKQKLPVKLLVRQDRVLPPYDHSL